MFTFRAHMNYSDFSLGVCVCLCASQVVADTNISAIVSQVESLTSSSIPSDNTDTHTAEPE